MHVFTPRLPFPQVFTPMSTFGGGQKLGRGDSRSQQVMEREGEPGSAWRPFPHPPETLAGPAVEAALCQAVLAPLKPALWRRLHTLRAPELQRLQQRQIALRGEAGPEGPRPAPALRSRIHARLAQLHAACAPRRKVALLLAVCHDVYAGLAVGENQGNEVGGTYLAVGWFDGCGSQVGGVCAHAEGRG